MITRNGSKPPFLRKNVGNNLDDCPTGFPVSENNSGYEKIRTFRTESGHVSGTAIVAFQDNKSQDEKTFGGLRARAASPAAAGIRLRHIPSLSRLDSARNETHIRDYPPFSFVTGILDLWEPKPFADRNYNQ